MHDSVIVSHFKDTGNSLENIINFSTFRDEFNEKLSKVLRYNEELYVSIKNNDSWREKLLETIAQKIKENISKTGELELPLISADIAENKASCRKTFESCEDYIWFEDRFLNIDSLILLERVLGNLNVKSVRILTSLIRNYGINEEFLNKIKKLYANFT